MQVQSRDASNSFDPLFLWESFRIARQVLSFSSVSIFDNHGLLRIILLGVA